MDNEKLEDLLLSVIVCMVLVLVIVGLFINYLYPLTPIIVPLVIMLWIIRMVQKKTKNHKWRWELARALFFYAKYTYSFMRNYMRRIRRYGLWLNVKEIL